MRPKSRLPWDLLSLVSGDGNPGGRGTLYGGWQQWDELTQDTLTAGVQQLVGSPHR